MAVLIRAHDNRNQPIIHGGAGQPLALTYFNLVRLGKGASYSGRVEGFETVYVVLTGKCNITVNGTLFAGIGQRHDIWSGRADSIYAPINAEVVIQSTAERTEVAIAGGICDTAYAPFRIAPEEVDMVDVGSNETKSHRRIFHILGQKTVGRSGNLLVSELYADEGCWSGYPPHKHDTERPPEETNFEEVYHYRFNPETGFGGQFCYDDTGAATAVMTRHGDTFLINHGYHPTVASPGHAGYIFTVLVGKQQRSLIQYFDPAHRHLMSKIPGIQAMRDKFK